MKGTREKKTSEPKPSTAGGTDKLSKVNCESNFYNSLRSDDPSKPHAETKMTFVPLNPSKRHEQTSHIFSTPDDREPSPVHKPQKSCVYIPSNVMFNDNYVERNPKISENRKLRYKVEERLKNEKKCFDDFHPKKNDVAYNKKINDTYKTNPLKIYNNEETRKFNEEEKLKKSNHTKAFNTVFNSLGIKRTLGGNCNTARDNYKDNNNNTVSNINSNRDRLESNKITSNNFDINKNAAILNRRNKDEPMPYFGKRHFGVAPCGQGNAMTYL